jgi:phosphatidylserine/phosphatidylglycerophosphate/cardiolipin synthase-like enzyme
MRTFLSLSFTALFLAAGALPARAQDRLCDPGDEDCRNILINYIRNETQGIDVGFWFMEDARYTTELIRRHQAGVPVRVLIDPRANPTYPHNAPRLAELQAAGIPMRKRLTNYILHWKTMLFHGQNVVEFSGANYSADAWRPASSTPYQSYVDEAIYFTSDTAIVNSFRTKFDDHWTDTVGWANYANITGPLTRRYGTFPQDPSLNFPPGQNYRTRSVSAYNTEQRAIDVIMYRITDQAHTNAILAAVNRGIHVRLITEPVQYREPSRLWHSWNVDRLYMGGVEVKHRAHAGLNHQKSVILYDTSTAAGDQTMVIFGSSNWTSPSASGQVEHNIFTRKPAVTQWFIDQFERKWNNTGGVIENQPFVPLPPDTPTKPTPAHTATGVTTNNPQLKWYGGPWAHLYDVWFGTTSTNMTRVATDLELGPSESAVQVQTYRFPGTLLPGTTYYWKVVAKTMALQTRTSPIWSFTTAGTTPIPPTDGTAEVVLYAGKATTRVGAWRAEADSSAAGAVRMRHPNANAAKLAAPLAAPADYFEMTFYAEAGRGYRLWIRGRADGNTWPNDSAYVQFSGSVTAAGSPIWRIGTTSATTYTLEDCNSCGVHAWGWQDNGYGRNVLGQLVYFENTGPQTIRVQTREDGLWIDQIVLSHTAFVTTSPGALKDDTRILAENDGTGGSPPPPPPPDEPPPPPPVDAGDILIFGSEATALGGGWRFEADGTAATGQKLRHPNASGAKLAAALAAPTHYADFTFTAQAGVDYRIWIRSKADSNNWANDSLFLQFSGSTNQAGTAVWRIGTTSAAEYNLEDCSGCGLSGWGWQDNGWGVNVMGPLVRFQTTGPQTLRIQTREDGLSLDQIVLSSSRFLSTAPGPLKNDTTILTRDN